jgi:hypothetical protein
VKGFGLFRSVFGLEEGDKRSKTLMKRSSKRSGTMNALERSIQNARNPFETNMMENVHVSKLKDQLQRTTSIITSIFLNRLAS